MRQLPFSDENSGDGMRARPFVKWVGGKRSLLNELLRRTPDRFNNYYEPFLGGGAFFFALRNITLDNGGGGVDFISATSTLT